MTNAGTSIEQGSIILLPFPFTDLSSSKKRPALVISRTEFNNKNEDIICCLITSNPNATGVKISKKDMESGSLEFVSTIKPHRIFTASKSIIYKILGKLSISKRRAVEKEITNLISIL